MLHPDELFERPMGELIVDIENKVVLEAHLQCAAHEMPLCKIILVVMSGDD
jgi:DEAD/DEAH box helicase domain-containing protein